jgi:hypothetical protein
MEEVQMMTQKIGVEIRQIQEEFNCGEFEAVNILLQLVAQEDNAQMLEEFIRDLPKAA